MHKIYWFSGTGNTLYIAREFAKCFTDTELISIGSLDRSQDVVFDSEMTGIFFPVYCFGVPGIIEKFLERVEPMKEQGDRFVYAVCTSGGFPGAALPIVEDTLQEKNINLNASFHIRMVSNYIPLSEPPDEKHMKATFEKARRALRIAVIAVKKHKKTRPLRVFPIDTFLKFVARRAVATLPASDAAFHVDENCTGCGICSQVCPASNISLDDAEKPVWHRHCEQCMACIQWCPVQAIQYKNITRNRKRYHHPDVCVGEIYRVRDEEQNI
ncbi:MAG: ferredoxin [Lentisphaerae bacterium ADurb.Bin242]|nr:MAG: ferredoxin [Lentisphaerae bacterium ADurb.Bin242]